MSKRNIIIIIVAVVLIIIGALLVFQPEAGPPLADLPKADDSKEEISLNQDNKKDSEIEIDPLIILKSQLRVNARSFIERYGTYSSDNRYGNLKILLPQMSVKLAQETVNEIIQKQEKEQEFFSLTTRVMNIDLKESPLSVEKIVFMAQVQEQKLGQEQTGVSQRIVEISYIQENNQWKVDEIKTN